MWFEVTGIVLLLAIIGLLYTIYEVLLINRNLLSLISANTDRRKSDRRKVTMSVAKEKRVADRRDNEIERLHTMYHEGDINIAPSFAEKELNKN